MFGLGIVYGAELVMPVVNVFGSAARSSRRDKDQLPLCIRSPDATIAIVESFAACCSAYSFFFFPCTLTEIVLLEGKGYSTVLGSVSTRLTGPPSCSSCAAQLRFCRLRIERAPQPGNLKALQTTGNEVREFWPIRARAIERNSLTDPAATMISSAAQPTHHQAIDSARG
jgi:hypothetical protein